MSSPVPLSMRPQRALRGAEAPEPVAEQVSGLDRIANYTDQQMIELGLIDPATYRGREPPRFEGPTVSAPAARSWWQRVQDAFTDARGVGGQGETAYLARRFEDLMNLDDGFMAQRFPELSAEEREARRDAELVRAVEEARGRTQMREEADPAWREDGSLLGNVGRFGATMAGDLAGNANPTYLIGFGSTALRRVAVQGVVNAAIDAGIQGGEIGEGVRAEFDPVQTGVQFIAGAALQGAGELAGPLARGARSGFERAVAAGWDRLPEAVQKRWAGAAGELPELDTPEYDILMADTAEALVGRENMAEHEIAGLAVLRRDAEIEAASPFTRNGAGADMHPQLLGAALQRLVEANPAAPRPTAATPRTTRAALVRSTSVASTVVPGDAQARFMARVRRAESSGNDAAKNPRSSATGRYQFTDGTWLAYYKRRFGAGGLTDRAILNKRGDGRLQDQLMADLTADNAAFLRSQGEAVSEGNLYLVHFAGQGGARRLFETDAGAPVERALGAEVVAANPHLRGMTVQDAIDWAHGAMGAAPGRRAGSRAEVRPDLSESEALQAEIDAITARLDTLGAERGADGGDPLADALDAIGDDLPGPIDAAEFGEGGLQTRDPALPDALPEPRAYGDDADAPDPLPRLRTLAADRGRSLNDIEGLAAELGLGAEDVRRGLTALALNGEIAMKIPRSARKRVGGQGSAAGGKRRWQTNDEVVADRGGVWDGTFMRRPPAPVRGERTLLERIADLGGMEDRGGDLRAMGGDDWHRAAPFRARLIRAHDAAAQASMLGPRMAGGNSPEALFESLIVDGYFPELLGRLDGATATDISAEKPDLGILYAAIADELQGKPVRSVDYDHAPANDARGPQPGGEEWEWLRGETEELLRDELGFAGEIAVDMLDELVSARLAAIEDGLTRDIDALYYATNLMAERNQAEAFARNPEADYDPIDYEPPAFIRSAAGRENLPTEEDLAGWYAEGADPPAGGVRGGADGEAGGADGQALAELAPEARSPFLDPDGDAAKAQADSLAHDARAEIQQSDGMGTLGRDDYNRRFGNLWLKSREELDDLFEAAKLSEAVQLQRAVDMIGLEPSEGLARTLESDHFDWDRAAARIEKEAAAAGLAVPDEADRLLNPKWDDPPINDLPMSEDVAALREAILTGGDDDVQMLTNELGWALRDLNEATIREVLGGTGRVTDQARLLTVRLATERLAELGVKPSEIPGRVAAGMVKNGVPKATAAELTELIFDALAKAAAPTRDALPAPLDRGAEVDPAITERQRQEAALGAEAPLRTLTPQDSTLGLGLFGAADGVRLDAEGEARPIADLLDELDAEAAEIKTIRDCLK